MDMSCGLFLLHHQSPRTCVFVGAWHFVQFYYSCFP